MTNDTYEKTIKHLVKVHVLIDIEGIGEHFVAYTK